MNETAQALEPLRDSIEVCDYCQSDKILSKFESNDKRQFVYIEYCKVCQKEWKI